MRRQAFQAEVTFSTKILKTKARWSVRLVKNELERCVFGERMMGKGSRP